MDLTHRRRPYLPVAFHVPELVLYLPWWRRLQVAWALVWRGRAPVPEMQTAVSLRRRHRVPDLTDLEKPHRPRS